MRSAVGIGAVVVVMLAGSLTWSTASAYEITCESKSGKAKRCTSDGRPEVRLVRQLGNKPCVLGESWGVDDEGLWVDRGCKAVFEISGLQKSSGGAAGSPKCPYGAGSNECEYWQDGFRAGREDAMANMSMAYQRHSDSYDSRFESAYAKGYEAGWGDAKRNR
jgi:ribosome modulation factor